MRIYYNQYYKIATLLQRSQSFDEAKIPMVTFSDFRKVLIQGSKEED